MNLLGMQLQKELRHLISNYAREIKVAKVDRISDGIRKFAIVPRKEKNARSGQDLAKEVTPECFKFLETFIRFVVSSKHIRILQLEDLFVSCAVNELLNYWVKNYISPCVYQFRQNLIDEICEQFKAFVSKYGMRRLHNLRVFLQRPQARKHQAGA